MSSTVVDVDPAVLLARFQQALTDLQQVDLAACTDTEIVEYWQGVETGRRMLETVDHTIIGQVETRHLPYEYGARTTGVLARTMRRISAGEANVRVANAHAAGPRTSLTGETLPASYPVVAAAQQAGTISRQQALIISKTIDKLPPEAQLVNGAWSADFLADQATQLDPAALGKITHHLGDVFDPDGRLDPERADRRRELRLFIRPDGSSRCTGELTPELTEHLRTGLGALSRPKPGPDGTRDPRSLSQRQHDALLDLIKLAMRADLLPDCGGVSSTIILTTSVESWLTGQGLVQTGHGVRIAVALNELKAVVAYGDKHRLFTETSATR